MLGERKSNAALLNDGIREEQERIAFLERTPERELEDALRRDLYDAEDAIPEDQWETLPRFVLDFLHKILDERGFATAAGLLEHGHTVHLLQYFPGVRDVLRRYDLPWHRTNLAVLERSLAQHMSSDSGGRAPRLR